MRSESIEIISSSGVLEVDADTGFIVDGLSFHGDMPKRIDISELKLRFGDTYAVRFTSFDILNVGYWDKRGIYMPPCRDWQNDTKEEVLQDLSEDVGFTIPLNIIPDWLFWRSDYDELKRWVCGNLIEDSTK